jgi:hypothetical protein
MNTPEAIEVYFPNLFTDKVKIAPHMTEWNKPTATNKHGLLTAIASRTNIAETIAANASCEFGKILLNEPDINLPTRIPPQ